MRISRSEPNVPWPCKCLQPGLAYVEDDLEGRVGSPRRHIREHGVANVCVVLELFGRILLEPACSHTSSRTARWSSKAV